MKKKVSLVLCWTIIAIGVLAVYYKIPVKNQLQRYAPAVEMTEPDTNTQMVKAFSVPDTYLAAGNYELSIQYDCTDEQKVEITRKLDENTSEEISEVVLAPGESEQIVDFSVGEEQAGEAINAYFYYTGVGSLEIKQVLFKEGESILYAADAKNLHSELVGANAGKVNGIPQLIAIYTFSDIPASQGFGVNTVSIDRSQYIYQVVQVGAYDWKYLLLDSSVDEDNYVPLGDYDNCTILLYQTGEAQTEVSVEVNNASVIAQEKKMIVGVMAAIVLLVLLIIILFQKNKNRIVVPLCNGVIAVDSAIALILWAYSSASQIYINVLLIFAILVAILVCMTKDYKREIIHIESEIASNKAFGAGLISVSISMLIFRQMLLSKEGSIWYFFNSENKMNLVDYALVVVICVVLFLIFNSIFQRKNWKIFQYCYSLGQEELIVSVLVLFLLIKNHFMTSPVLIVFVFVVIYTGCMKWKQFPFSRICVYGSYVCMIALWFIANLPTNIFREDMHHAGAYLDPLYNVYAGEAFAGGQADLYGHYSLFFKPLYWVFGSSSLAIAVYIAVICTICAIAMVTVIHNTIQSDFIRILATIVVGSYGLQSRLFFQVFPHRDLFPFMLMAVCAIWMHNKLNRTNKVIGFVICGLALLWNTESGAVVCLGWLTFYTLKQIQDQEQCFAKAVGVALKCFIIEAVIGVGTLGIVGVYNSFVGKENTTRAFDLKESTGVLLNSDYMLGFHQTLLTWENESWLYIMFFMIIVFLYALSRTGIVGKAFSSERSILLGVIATQGLSLMTYFMNRVSMGWEITFPFVALLIVVVLDGIINHYQIQETKSIVRFASYVTGMCLMAFVSLYVMQFPDLMKEVYDGRVKYTISNHKLMEEQLDAIRNEVPADTWARGNGTGLLYMELGWNRQDAETEPNTQYILYSEKMDLLMDKYRLIKTYKLGEYEYGLYYNSDYR